MQKTLVSARAGTCARASTSAPSAASAPAGTASGAEEAAVSARGGGRRERGAELEMVLAENEALKQAIRRFEEEVLSHDDL
jgi:hypothetical protein